MQLHDTHVHTRYSACCHENYDLRKIARIHEVKGFSYACVSDHVHDDNDGAFMTEHARVRNDLLAGGFPLPIFIGIEASIVDIEGHLPLSSVARTPDYIMCSYHWIPATKITMDDLPSSARIVKAMHDHDPSGLRALYVDVASMYVNAMACNKIDILAHPFDTFMRIENFDQQLLDVFGTVCEACQAHGVAIEINNKAVERQLELFTHNEPLHDDCLPAAEFYTRLMKIPLDYDVQFSTGSDAHVVHDIGVLDHAASFMESLNIPERKLFSQASRA
jgi:histidinol phosphatase-like PHP family hydrolase